MKKLNEFMDCSYDIEINDIKTNSKEIKQGDLFVCTKGFKEDRHDYIKDAEARGAAALVVSHDVDSNLPTVKVKDTNEELINIVNRFYDYPSSKMTMIGVTGTDGKTSTSTIIYQLINSHKKAGYIGTNGVQCPTYEDNANNTTPAPEYLHKYIYNFYQNNCDAVVMEASSEAMAMHRLDSMEFDFGVFTNLTHEHLNYHKTMENYLEAKATLLKQTKKDGYDIINIDDEYGKEIAKRANGHVIYYGKDEEADFRFFDVEVTREYTKYKLSYKDKVYDIDIPLLGMFNVYNMTAGLAVLTLMGFDINELKPYFKDLFVDGRMTNIDLGQDFKVIIDYAHTPNGYLNLFELTKMLESNRTIVVAGSAGERDSAKRPVMGEILVNNADYVIFTYEDPRTEDPRDIIEQMISNVKDKKDKYEIVVDRHEAIKRAIDIAEPGNMVLVLGKGNETYETIGKEKIYFNDFEEAKQALTDRLREKVKE